MPNALYCQKIRLPPDISCDNAVSIDLDTKFPKRPPSMKIADCLVLCSGGIEWIIEVKRSYLKEFLDQMEQTIDFLNQANNENNNAFFLKDSMKFLIIMKKGLGKERLFEVDSNKYLKRKGGSYIKIINKYKIMVWKEKDIDQVVENERRLMGKRMR